MPVGPCGRNIELLASDLVASPSVLSTTLLFSMSDKAIRGREVFDVGCGTGYLGLGLLARGAERFCGSDISPEAIDLATETASANGLSDRADFRLGDLFGPFGDARFGIIVANPPQTPTAMLDSGGRRPRAAIDGGAFGHDQILRVFAASMGRLQTDGRLYMACSSLAHPSAVMARAEELYCRVEICAHHEMPLDTWRLRHLDLLTERALQGQATLTIRAGHPCWSVDILCCREPRE